MPEKEPQFFARVAEQKSGTAEDERGKKLGLRAETEIVLPLFEELEKENIISNACKTSPEVDSGQKVDFILEFSPDNFVAIDVCLADPGTKRWENKLKEWGNNPLRELGRVHPDYEKKYERFFGSHEGASRLELIAIQKERAQTSPEEIRKLKEKIPMVCVYMNKEEMEGAIDKHDREKAPAAVDALYNKDTMKLKFLEGIATCLSQYVTNQEFIKKYNLKGALPLVMPKYRQAVQVVEALFLELQRNPARLGHNEVERKVAVNKTNEFLEKHKDVLK